MTSKPFICDHLIAKKKFIAAHQLKHVLQRLSSIKNNPPPQIPALLNWGLLPTGEVIFWQTRVCGETLRRWLTHAPPPRACSPLADQLLRLSQKWASHGFIHGDLNLDNLLVSPKGELIAVDWILDLESFEGTPAFAHDSVFQGQHNLATDSHSLALLAHLLIKEKN